MARSREVATAGGADTDAPSIQKEDQMSEQSKAVVRRLFEEVLTGGRLAVADEVFTAGYHDHDPANEEDVRGPEGAKAEIAGYRAAFPDLSVTVQDQLAEGDLVATRFTIAGTHLGELMGVAPSGNKMRLPGIVIHRMVGGRIDEGHWNWDTAGLLRAIGALPVETAA
jgi:predicted ester cyclase